MRSTLEIIVATEEELRLALLALSAVHHFVKEELQTLVNAVNEDKASAKLRAGFAKGTIERMFAAMKTPPAEWLGPGGIPGNPEYDRRLAGAKALLRRATGTDLCRSRISP